jgi:hypothetical protein
LRQTSLNDIYVSGSKALRIYNTVVEKDRLLNTGLEIGSRSRSAQKSSVSETSVADPDPNPDPDPSITKQKW